MLHGKKIANKIPIKIHRNTLRTLKNKKETKEQIHARQKKAHQSSASQMKKLKDLEKGRRVDLGLGKSKQVR